MKFKTFDNMFSKQQSMVDNLKAQKTALLNSANRAAEAKDKKFFAIDNLLKNNPITNFLAGKGLAILDEDTYAIYLNFKHIKTENYKANYSYTLTKFDKKTDTLLDTYAFKFTDTDTTDTWDKTEIVRFLSATFVKDEEAGKMLYLWLTKPEFSSLGSTKEMICSASTEKSAGMGETGLALLVNGVNESKVAPSGLSLDEMIQMVKKLCKGIVDAIMKLDKFRSDMVLILKKANENFADDTLCIENYTKVKKVGKLYVEVEAGAKYVLSIKRSLDENCYGLPVKIKCNVTTFLWFDPEENPNAGYSGLDANGNVIEVLDNIDFRAFLYIRFGKVIPFDNIDKVIDECIDNASNGALGMFGSSKALKVADKLLGNFVGKTVDKYTEKAMASISDKLDKFQVDEVEKGFVLSSDLDGVLDTSSNGKIIKNKFLKAKYYTNLTQDSNSSTVNKVNSNGVFEKLKEFGTSIINIYSFNSKVLVVYTEIVSTKIFKDTTSENIYNDYKKQGVDVPSYLNLYNETKTTYTKFSMIEADGKTKEVTIPTTKKLIKLQQISTTELLVLLEGGVVLYITPMATYGYSLEGQYILSDFTLVKNGDAIIDLIVLGKKVDSTQDIDMYFSCTIEKAKENFISLNPLYLEKIKTSTGNIISESNSLQLNSKDHRILVVEGIVLFFIPEVFGTPNVLDGNIIGYFCSIDTYLAGYLTSFIVTKHVLYDIEVNQKIVKEFIFSSKVNMVQLLDLSAIKIYDTTTIHTMKANTITTEKEITTEEIMYISPIGGTKYSRTIADGDEDVYNAVGDIYILGRRIDGNKVANMTFKKTTILDTSKESTLSTKTTPIGTSISKAKTILLDENTPSTNVTLNDTTTKRGLGDIAIDKLNLKEMSTSLKTNAQNSTILQKTFGKTISIEGFTVNKTFFVKNVLNSHTDMIKEIYEKLKSAEAKIASVPTNINPILVTQYAQASDD